MSIEEKIKQIQNKPEKARMAYIYIFVTIIMTFVVVLWIFSVRVDVRAVVNDVDNATTLPDGGTHLQEIRDVIRESGDVITDTAAQTQRLEETVAPIQADAQAQTPQEESDIQVQ